MLLLYPKVALLSVFLHLTYFFSKVTVFGKVNNKKTTQKQGGPSAFVVVL